MLIASDGAVNTFYLHPGDVGLPKAPLGALEGGDAQENARVIERVLAGDRGPARDVVLLNAGAALYMAGVADSIQAGIGQAADELDSGRAHRKVADVAATSQKIKSELAASAVEVA